MISKTDRIIRLHLAWLAAMTLFLDGITVWSVAFVVLLAMVGRGR